MFYEKNKWRLFWVVLLVPHQNDKENPLENLKWNMEWYPFFSAPIRRWVMGSWSPGSRLTLVSWLCWRCRRCRDRWRPNGRRGRTRWCSWSAPSAAGWPISIWKCKSNATGFLVFFSFFWPAFPSTPISTSASHWSIHLNFLFASA